MVNVILKIGNNGQCYIGCNLAVPFFDEKDYVALYKDSKQPDNKYITWQYALKCKDGVFYNTGKKYRDGYEVRYIQYDPIYKEYRCVAKTSPLSNIGIGKNFSYQENKDNWIWLGQNDGKFVISWDIKHSGQYDWIGIYEDSKKSDSSYEKYIYINSEKSPYKTNINIQAGYEIRFFEYKGWFKSDRKCETEGFPQLQVYSSTDRCPRPITDSEFDFFKFCFPKLERKDIIVTDDETGRYNCIAWSLGLNDRWIYPDNPSLNNKNLSLKEFLKKFYRECGYIIKENGYSEGVIDGWIDPVTNEPTHGSKKYNESLWESKCGPNLRITHKRNALEGKNYGKTYFSCIPMLKLPNELLAKPKLYSMNLEEKNILKNEIEKINKKVRRNFSKYYKIWSYSIKQSRFAISSNIYDYQEADGFEDIIQLGTNIIPLVISKIINSNHFWAIVIYEKLQENENLCIKYTSNDSIEILLEGEEARSKRTVKKWIESLK